jgi:hypothetical protein
MRMRLLVLGTLLWLAVVVSAVDKPGSPSAGFETLKSLAGRWSATTPDGKNGDLTLKVIAGGSALMELEPESDMVSVIHPDNGRLLMTHYGGAKNQPRMQGEISPDGKQFRFDFIDGTNLSASDGHMKQMTLTINDNDHVTENWVFLQNNGKEITEVWHLTRKP